MKIIYIAHPVGGDVKNNIDRILKIIRHINLTEPDTVPFAPYIPDVLCMEDANPAERQRGIVNDIALIKAGFIDECRLYGPRISPGMQAEKELFESLGIPVTDYTEPEAPAGKWIVKRHVLPSGGLSAPYLDAEDEN